MLRVPGVVGSMLLAAGVDAVAGYHADAVSAPADAKVMRGRIGSESWWRAVLLFLV